MDTNFGEKLKNLREFHFPGESLRKVGKRFESEFGEFFYTQLSKIETGTLLPSSDFLLRISKAYRLSPEEMAELVASYIARKVESLNLVPKHHEFAAGKLFHKVKKDKKCVFCDIAKKTGDKIVDIEPLNPVVKGHRIVFHNRHSSDFTDDIGITMEVMGRASEIAKKIGGEFNLITSKGLNATQSVFHLHVHLVPRKENDGLKLPWTDQIKSHD